MATIRRARVHNNSLQLVLEIFIRKFLYFSLQRLFGLLYDHLLGGVNLIDLLLREFFEV